MKRSVLYTLILLGFLVSLTHFNALAANEVHKRTVNGKEEYEFRIANSTRWFVIILIDGSRRGPLNPAQEHPNAWDGSMLKLWLTLGPHKITAFAYESRKDILNDKPVQRIKETLIDITNSVDKERHSNSSFRLPILELEEDNFEPWTTPAYRDKNRKHH